MSSVGVHPPGIGWSLIPGSAGYHRRGADGQYTYWYPHEGFRHEPHPADKDHLHLPVPPPAEGFKLSAPAGGKVRDNSGRRVHHDIGEKVAGARKERWEQVHSGNLGDLEAQGEAIAYKHTTKEAVLGDASGETDQALGSSAGAAYLKREIRKMISARPTVADMTPAEARRAYVAGTEWLGEALDQCKTVQDVEALRDEFQWLARDGGTYDEAVPLTNEAMADLARRFPGGQGWGTTLFLHPRDDDGKKIGKDAEYRVSGDAMRRAGYAIRHLRDGAPEVRKLAVRQYPYKAWAESMGPRVVASFGLQWSESSNDTWRKHRREAERREKAGDWTDLLDSTKTARNAEDGGEKDRLDVHKEIGIRRQDVLERVGGPPLPRSLNGDALASTFGLRAVQYGNQIDDEVASAHIRAAHGALVDLADVLGIDPKMLAHGQQLALAIGARGSGRANAHYESDQRIINLTATRGGGALAHEWAHFSDHALGGLDFKTDGWTRAPSFLSDDRGMPGSHPEVVAAVRGVMKAIHGKPRPVPAEIKAQHQAELVALGARRRTITPLRGEERAKAADEYNKAAHEFNTRRGAVNARHQSSDYAWHARTMGEYWSRDHELFARAFESYVEDKLHSQGRKNTYLVTGTREPMKLRKVKDGVAHEDLEVYPQGEERAAINAAFDGLTAALQRTGALRKALRRAALAHLLKPVPAGARIHRIPA